MSSGNPPIDGNPKELYMLCKNTGYDATNPDINADNSPDLSQPEGDPSWYMSMQVQCQIYVADNNSADANADHAHWMSSAGMTHVSQEAGQDGHFHYSWVKADGTTRWSLEEGVVAATANAGVQAYDVDGDGDTDIIINPPGAGSLAVPFHEHETVNQYVTNSVGEEYTRMRPKFMMVIARMNTYTHQYTTDNGGGSTIILAERPYISGDDADPNTWQFEAKASNEAWDQAYRDQVNNNWMSRFGLSLPVDDGSGDIGITNDRRFVQWWYSINRYQWADETRTG